MKDFFIGLFLIVTFPIWIIVLIIVFSSLPKDFWEKYDEYRSAEDEMFGF